MRNREAATVTMAACPKETLIGNGALTVTAEMGKGRPEAKEPQKQTITSRQRRALARPEDYIDGGWAWVVLFSSFMLQFLICGMAYTTGVFNVVFLEVFDTNKATTSWPGAIMNGVYPLVGPISSAAVRRCGWRITVIVGGVLFTLGLYTSAWAESIYHMVISYGLIAGIGMGIAYTPALTVIGYYFHRRRTMAAGVACMGAAISIITYPILTNVLNDIFSWRGTLMIMSGLSLHTCVFGMLLRPLPSKQFTSDVPMNEKREKRVSYKTSEEEMYYAKQRVRYIFKNKAFLLFCLSQFFLCVAIAAIYLHLAAYAMSNGATTTEAYYLYSITGFVSIFSRFMTGMAGNHDTIENSLLYIGSNGVAGVLTLFCPLFMRTFLGRQVYASALGFYGSCFNSLLAPMTVEIVGVYNLNMAFGLEMLADGIGFLVGPPLAGWLSDVTGTYSVGFVLAGTCLIVSAAIMFLVPIVDPRRRTKSRKTNITVNSDVLEWMVTSL